MPGPKYVYPSIYEGYGMSEMAPISGANAVTGVRLGSVGKPVSGGEVQAVDLDTGLRVLPQGELRVRGPHMRTGYRNRPEETRQTIRDGFNVFPREVEEVIQTHPKVGMVGVVGMPDARTGGERLVAFIVPQTGEMIDPAEIFAYCAPRLVNYKCPSEVRVVEQLPLTAAHKLDRAALPEPAAARSHRPPEPSIVQLVD